MCCLLTVLLFLGPRVAGILWWIVQPTRWNLAFGSFIWPILGLIFVPFTTLMYVLLATGPGGVGGFDWVWVGLAVVADILSYGGGGFGNRDRIRGYTSN